MLGIPEQRGIALSNDKPPKTENAQGQNLETRSYRHVLYYYIPIVSCPKLWIYERPWELRGEELHGSRL